ncbi:hypothetical protein NECAME_00992 [Necator americanus]|uniref:Uncharacterized protein n=1 Tax=Necator americanus TaxID=51031 RepID=W2SK59_NECAM|nr:hypothetical protein NECAME_00992 [Necator americanus]ETN70044.1 hypothetical protein NECAME_00992 [Necator americanus]
MDLQPVFSQRFGLIQTPQQLMFSWHAIVDALQQQNDAKESFSENGTDSDVNVNEDRLLTTDKKAKRRTVDREEDSTEDRVAKRREMVARMVARSREAEAVRRSYVGSLANQLGVNPTTVFAAGGALIFAVVVGYYTYKR